MAEDKKVSVDLTDDLSKKLLIGSWARTPSEAIKKLSDRYYYFITKEKEKITQIFSEEELIFIRVFCHSIDWSPVEKLCNGVLQEISDIEDEIYLVYKVSRTQLEGKLRSLTELQQFALVEYIEEYWYITHDYTNIGKPEKEYTPDPENEGKSGEELIAEVVKAINCQQESVEQRPAHNCEVKAD